MQWSIWPLLLLFLFLVYSLPLFLRVYATTQSVIDEEFHLRQGLHFCNKRFDVWDSKITTFPGLYLFSLVLNPFGLCSVLGLRLISLIAAAINIVILYKIRLHVLGNSRNSTAALEAAILAALPPLHFFSHLYYTDTLSMTTVLLFYYFWLKESHLQASVFAAASVLMRQTNIVWVGMLFGTTALDELAKTYASATKTKFRDVKMLSPSTWLTILTSHTILFRSIWNVLKKCCYYLVILLPFVCFVFLNGSIVVGDKRAHEATLHLPQLFYFGLFTLFFGITNIVQNLRSTLQWLLQRKLVTLLLIGVCMVVVWGNTLVHPYLLADNRHYTFYIWNRFYGRYSWFRYAIVPVYVLTLALVHRGLQHMRDSFRLMFWVAVVLVLCFQRLLEVRYFLIPFVLFRLNARPFIRNHLAQWLELGYFIGLNALTFYIFLSKEIKWRNFQEPQRIMW